MTGGLPVKQRLTQEAAHVWARLSGQTRRAQRSAKREFSSVLSRLTSDDVAVDLGANAGEFTGPMADTGAHVHAFEPDPHAYEILRKSHGHRPNVTLIKAAAGLADGTARLYRSSVFEKQPDRRSKSSSLFAEKHNVDDRNAVTVEVLDFLAFIDRLNRPIALIKMDIEGGEVPLMEALLSSPQAARIGHVFVETHERGLPHLARRTATLKAATASLTSPRVNWDWH